MIFDVPKTILAIFFTTKTNWWLAVKFHPISYPAYPEDWEREKYLYPYMRVNFGCFNWRETSPYLIMFFTLPLLILIHHELFFAVLPPMIHCDHEYVLVKLH